MSKPRIVDQCAFCGMVKPITRDHVPPRNLFPKPRSSNLITVPSCEDCRAGWSDDDEYFRLHAISSRASSNASAQEIVRKIADSLGKPAKAGYARMIAKSLCEASVYTPGGLFLGHAPALKIDDKRFGRVMRRIITGLFFEERRRPLPSTHEAKGYVCEADFPDPILCILENSGAEFCPVKEVQRDVFEYSFLSFEEDRDTTLWIGSFYESIRFFGATRRIKGA